MKICGFKFLDFVDKETGAIVKGFQVFNQVPLDGGKGYFTEKHFISDDVCQMYDINSAVLNDVFENQKDIILDKRGKKVTGVFML